MSLRNNFIFSKMISVYDIILTASLCTNVACLTHFQDQNKKIIELIEKNNILTDSVNKLSQDITKMGQEMTIEQSKSLPVVINTSETAFFTKPLVVLGVLAVSLGTTYFISSAIITKVSAVSIPKFVSFASILTKLPFFEQPKELTVTMKELSISLFIRILNDQVKDIRFRHIDDEVYKPIKDLFELYIKSKNTQDFSTGTNNVIIEKLATATSNEVISKALVSCENSVVSPLMALDNDSINMTTDIISNIF